MSTGYNAMFVSQSVPTQMTAGLIYTVSVTMKNTGTTTWTRDTAYKLGSQNPQDNTRWSLGRVELGPNDAIAPNQTKQFDFQVRAPSTAGTYAFQWRVLRELVEWFGDFTPSLDINVASSSTLRVKYRYHVIACGYPRYNRDAPADAVNERWPEFGYWQNGVVGGTWMAKAQNTTEYGMRTLGFCRDNAIRVLTGWWDINDQVALTNTIMAFQGIDLSREPLKLAYMFGAQNFRNPNFENGKSLDSYQPILDNIMSDWGRAANNRGHYAWITDGARVDRPIVMIWGDPSFARNTTKYYDYLINHVRPAYRTATNAEPFIIMVNQALSPSNIRDLVYKGADAIYNHACALDVVPGHEDLLGALHVGERDGRPEIRDDDLHELPGERVDEPWLPLGQREGPGHRRGLEALARGGGVLGVERGHLVVGEAPQRERLCQDVERARRARAPRGPEVDAVVAHVAEADERERAGEAPGPVDVPGLRLSELQRCLSELRRCLSELRPGPPESRWVPPESRRHPPESWQLPSAPT